MNSNLNKIIQNENILREIQSFTSINSLLLTTKLLLDIKRSCYHWILSREATLKYFSDDMFRQSLFSIVGSPPHRQIFPDEYVFNNNNNTIYIENLYYLLSILNRLLPLIMQKLQVLVQKPLKTLL